MEIRLSKFPFIGWSATNLRVYKNDKDLDPDQAYLVLKDEDKDFMDEHQIKIGLIYSPSDEIIVISLSDLLDPEEYCKKNKITDKIVNIRKTFDVIEKHCITERHQIYKDYDGFTFSGDDDSLTQFKLIYG